MSYNTYFRAHDSSGQAVPFTVSFVLRKWNGSEYEDMFTMVIFSGEYAIRRLEDDEYYEAEPSPGLDPGDGWIVPGPVQWHGCDDGSRTIIFVFDYEIVLAFANIAVSRRYGNRFYLSGSLDNIAESDDICVYYKRPGDTGIRNLKSDTSDYLHFSGTSGSYDLGANNRYIEFDRAGYYWLKVWDVVGDCETPIRERASWLINLAAPRFQYQVIFDRTDPDLGDNLHLLEAEYAKYESAGWWEITHEDPDCFPNITGHGGGVDETPQSGWLSLGVEFGESPCAPLPYYLCPLPTPQTQYWRGECSCDDFRNTLQPLGIPCWHLIAAMNWYAGKPAWSPYVQCP